MCNSHLHILISIHPINNLLFPTTHSFLQELPTISIKSRLILNIEVIQCYQNLLTKYLYCKFLMFWTIMVMWSVKSTDTLRKWLQLWIKYLLWPAWTRLLICCYWSLYTLLLRWHLFSNSYNYYAINKIVLLNLFCLLNIYISELYYFYSLMFFL